MPEAGASGGPAVGESVEGAVVIIDPAAEDLIEDRARLTRLTEGGIWAEGPVWLPLEQAVVYSDVRADRGIRWSESSGGVVWREPNDHTNGNTLDREGRVIHCDHGQRRIARTEPDGTRHGLVDRHDGRRLNSPNDVVVKSDGTIWFTDPPYGIVLPDEGVPAPQEQPACFVYRFDPETGELSVATDAIVHPNGLAFSPDEKLLYVADTSAALDPTGNHHIAVLDVIEGQRLGRPRIVAVMEPGLPDGLRVDEHGNIWSSAGDGIHVLAPDGRDLAAIRVPEVTSNCVFGGRDGRCLFITASSSLYSIETRVRGSGVAAGVLARASPGWPGDHITAPTIQGANSS
jgi:gluconolactonase